ncbi:hypothetical protein [Streptomyces sp. A5-4]|uniref:hypothetical protein n=1 Tax=Streptomyces sp. A5-4 TaxID=3384771 RepID=UPI003DA9DE16
MRRSTFTGSAPAPDPAVGKLYLGWRTVTRTLRVSTQNGSTWSAPTDLQASGYGTPALITRPDSVQALYLACTLSRPGRRISTRRPGRVCRLQ